MRGGPPAAGARRHAAALGVALALAAGAAGAGSSEEDPAQELEEVRKAIAERRERIEAFEEQERSLLETVEAMDQAAARLARRAGEARREAEQARRQLAELEREAAALGRRRDRLAEAMKARAVALYKAGAPGPLRVLFDAESLADLLARTRGLRALLEHDRRLLGRFRRGTAALEEARERMHRAAVERDRALRLLRARTREVERERAAKRELLRRTRRDRASERAALAELEAAALALEETLDELRRAPADGAPGPDAVPFADLRGQLEPPVEQHIARGFGRVVDAEFRTETFRKGVDFRSPVGEPVQAVADGRVRFAGWFRGYGRMVILDHGGGYFTVSAHLAEAAVEVGDAVSAGDRIGTVGETGSLSGPRLYFEIRHAGMPLDPAEWLRPESAG